MPDRYGLTAGDVVPMEFKVMSVILPYVLQLRAFGIHGRLGVVATTQKKTLRGAGPEHVHQHLLWNAYERT